MTLLIPAALFLLWAAVNAVFAFVEPPGPLRFLAPRKVIFVFALLPQPLGRRLGMLFNSLLGVGMACLIAYYAFAY